VDSLIEGHGVWYFIIICFLVRAVLLMFANNTGVTGGLFVPTLAFGALIGALCGKAMLALGIIEVRFYSLLIVIGMVSFLAASSRTPITALVFAVEALCGLSNILPVGIGVTIAFLVIETAGVECFNDTVIETKVDKQNAGKTAQIFDMRLTVSADTFVVCDKNINLAGNINVFSTKCGRNALTNNSAYTKFLPGGALKS
jgi:H+/Cl- antiporter ClcA